MKDNYAVPSRFHTRTAMIMRLTLLLLSMFFLVPFSHADIPSSPPILTIYNFGAFVSADPFIPSHIGFRVVDRRLLYHLDAVCTFVTSETYPSIYLDRWWPCTDVENHEELIEYWIDKHFVKLRRPWLDFDFKTNV